MDESFLPCSECANEVDCNGPERHKIICPFHGKTIAQTLEEKELELDEE